MKRSQFRARTMKYVYQHVLLNKPFLTLFAEEGHLMKQEESPYIVNTLRDIETNEESYVAAINSHLNQWSFERLSYVEQAILLVAWSELERKEDDKAVVIDEAIKLAKTYSDESSYPYINAVLDKHD